MHRKLLVDTFLGFVSSRHCHNSWRHYQVVNFCFCFVSRLAMDSVDRWIPFLPVGGILLEHWRRIRKDQDNINQVAGVAREIGACWRTVIRWLDSKMYKKSKNGVLHCQRSAWQTPKNFPRAQPTNMSDRQTLRSINHIWLTSSNEKCENHTRSWTASWDHTIMSDRVRCHQFTVSAPSVRGTPL